MAIFDAKNLEQKRETTNTFPLIMLIDDEQENLNVLRHLLEPNYEILCASNGIEAVEMINDMDDPKKVQLIICDQRMPELSGVDFFAQIVDIMPDTIRMILTGYSDVDAIIDSINKASIYKFITKPFEPAELILTVQRGIETFNMRQKIAAYTNQLEEMVQERTKELEEALNALQQASITDQLTGAHNRRFVDEFIESELCQLRRHYFQGNGITPEPRLLGFILIDADNFKNVNDTYGHDAGDKVLIQLTQVLKTTCRESDWVIRWGGEEFLVISKNKDLKGVEILAERIRQNIEDSLFDIGGNQRINRTCSLGISTFPFSTTDVDFTSWEQTLFLADTALYRSKNGGRNKWTHLYAKQVELTDSFKASLLDDPNQLVKQGLLGEKQST